MLTDTGCRTMPSPAYTVYAWIREDATDFVAVVLASAAPPYAGREFYERRWESRTVAASELGWMARALATRIRSRGDDLVAVKVLRGPPSDLM